MQNKMNIQSRILKKLIATAALVTVCFTGYIMAQVPPPGPGAGGPIDGGAVALVAGAALYGYKKLKDREKEKTRSN